MLWVPPGFGHGFLSLEDDTEFLYRCTGFYAPEHERSLAWNDAALAIDWPLAGHWRTLTITQRCSRLTARTGGNIRMKALVFGGGGQLGRALQANALAGWEIDGFDLPECDITDEAATRRMIADGKYDIVINAAAYTQVDKAEAEAELAQKINGDAPGWMASECAKSGKAFRSYFDRFYLWRRAFVADKGRR